MWEAMAVAIIFGLLFATALTLGTQVALVAAPGRSLPASSGLARLQPPSDDVVARSR